MELFRKIYPDVFAFFCEYHLVDINFHRKFPSSVEDKAYFRSSIIHAKTESTLHANLKQWKQGAAPALLKYITSDIEPILIQISECYRRESLCYAFATGNFFVTFYTL